MRVNENILTTTAFPSIGRDKSLTRPPKEVASS